MISWKKYLAGFLAAVGVFFLVWLYGHYQFKEGFQKRDAQATKELAALTEEARKKEQHLLLELEEAYHDAYEQEQISQATIATLSDDVDRLRRSIKAKATSAKLPSSSTGTDAVAAACWVALEESVQRYAEMAGIADGYVEDLRKGQGWAKAVSSSP